MVEIHPQVRAAVTALLAHYPTGHRVLESRTAVWFKPGHGVVLETEHPQGAGAFLLEHHPLTQIVKREPGSPNLFEIGLRESNIAPNPKPRK